jgi:hypothetical protein
MTSTATLSQRTAYTLAAVIIVLLADADPSHHAIA